MNQRFRVTFASGRVIDGQAPTADEAALIASRLLDPDDAYSARRVDLLVGLDVDESDVVHP